MKLQKSQITVDGLLGAVSRGREAILEAANIMVALVDQDPRIYEKILKQAPNISLNLLTTLEKVGRGQIYHALLFDSSPGARRLLALPFSQQKEHYEHPVKVVVVKGGKKIEVEKPIQQLSPAEVRVVFADDHVRTVTEQCKVVDQTLAPVKRSAPAERYTILKNGNLLILANTEFTPSQLQEVYERVVGKAVKSLAKGFATEPLPEEALKVQPRPS